ncbi:division/cell wall cluster transcriptional repressor MraZ [Candidatus Parcubacteria bacterium]|nr:MAG: division/cell wall cluster transcriptional repressor MraZ [Candidatus Parcubacteria bacterium]
MEYSGDSWKKVVNMLIGQVNVKVGEKGRIAFPKKFREELGDKVIITYGFENSLMIVPEKNWKSLLEGTENKPFILSGARDTQRFLLGGAATIELDSQGRFVLPEYLRDFAGVSDEVVFIGLYRYVEVWDAKKWTEYRKNMQKNISEVAEKLIEKIDANK